MRLPRKIDKEEGLLSIDFIVGFTIFMVALIFVAIMISGLLVHLQSRTIDYDAVAYRTSVVLVEDPGEPNNWHLKNMTFPAERDDVKRLGLAVDKNYPGILKLNKVEKFFNYDNPPQCSDKDQFCVPEDYRERLIFGDYPYRFNISMKGLGSTDIDLNVGNPIPSNSSFGYIKRIVKIQMPATTYEMQITDEEEPNESALKYNDTLVRIDFSDLYARPSPYRIDPLNEALNITINGFENFTNPPTIKEIKICTYPLVGVPGCVLSDAYEDAPRINVLVDGGAYSPPQQVEKNITVIIDDGYFQRIGFDRFDAVDTKITFIQNVTNQSVFFYNYSTVDPLPWLEPAVIEVRVW
jgi:hypothetical protein